MTSGSVTDVDVLIPTMMNSTAEMTPAISEYGRRVRTTSRTSASCVSAEAMVVSEMGARLSPKIAPLTMAPTTTEGFAPTVAATGSSTGSTATMAPLDVPQAVEISRQTRNATSGRKPALRPSFITSQVRP